MASIISLNGIWEFKEFSSNKKEWLKGCVPGCVQLDLLNLKKIDFFFNKKNEHFYYGLEDKEWIYRKIFNYKTKKKYRKVYLIFEGIDTFAEIYLNSFFIGSTENMFITYKFDIYKYLKNGENLLEVKIFSTAKKINDLKNKDNNEQFKNLLGVHERVYCRKAQYSFGWDFAPRVLQTGIWRSVYIKLIDEVEIKPPFFKTKKIIKDKAYIEVGAEIEKFNNSKIKCILNVSFRGKVCCTKIKNIRWTKRIKYKIKISNPQLWFPNKIGKPNLYKVTIIIKNEKRILDKISFNAGIRIVKLIQRKDRAGKSFIFNINGNNIFIKGTNWVPADILLPRLKEEDYLKYIKMMRDVGINMVRIWGGGIYENKIFYSLCDKYGIMIWQDFMFACAQYPDHLKWFRNLVFNEAKIIVSNLRVHPSIVIWCGNNENNWGFYDWWEHKSEPKFCGNYIYKKILPKICNRDDGTRPYVISSPYGGKSPNSPNEGDMHIWDVWHNLKDYKEFFYKCNPRFITEFGMQSLPDRKTIKPLANKKIKSILDPLLCFYNKDRYGMEKLIKYIIENFGWTNNIDNFIYLSQLNQAEVIKTAVEYYRMRKFKTAGILFWQFNDCWPCISWSCIDYYKRKKALFYYLKWIYSEILVTLIKNNEYFELWIINDLLKNVSGNLEIKIYNFIEKKVIFKEKIKVVALANSSNFVKKFSKSDLESKIKNLNQVIIFLKFFTKVRSYENYFLFNRFKELAKVKNLWIKYKKERNVINLISNSPLIGVYINTEKDVLISDNYIFMEPNKKYKIKIS